MMKQEVKDIQAAFKIGFRMGSETITYINTAKKKQNLIKHVEYSNLLYKQLDQLKDKYK